ncbi:MAG TPA: aldolase/citrate lyase family protein [Chloroflexota bacterium]|nr:aldolase/citrate lyase family protein [Chloroflexota bacterium]
MPRRVNRAIELLEEDQPIYYVGGHTGHVLTYEQGRKDARTWADYINVGMEHGAFDLAGLADYMRGLVDGGPTASGHRTPAVIVEAPVNGTDEASIRVNAWQFRQILGRGVHGILLCQAESPDAVRAFVESCRYPHHLAGVDPSLPSPVERLRGAAGKTGSPGVDASGRPYLGLGTRGRGSEPTAAAIWGLSAEEYLERCDVWPLNPRGELLLGVKIESPEGVARCAEILAVPGIGFAELGPGDLGLSLGYVRVPREPYPPEMQEARERVFAACRRYGIAFLEGATPESIARKIDEGVRIISGQREDTAAAGRAYSRRTMPV